MRIRHRTLNWFIAWSVVSICRVLFRTLRIQYLVSAPNTNPYSNDGLEGFIYCVWHDAITYPMFAGRHVRTAALVSQNTDNSHISFGLQMLGIRVVRGSSSRGGAAAIRELLRLPANTHLVLTPDGPRGPRREAKLGMVFLAAHSGRNSSDGIFRDTILEGSRQMDGSGHSETIFPRVCNQRCADFH